MPKSLTEKKEFIKSEMVKEYAKDSPDKNCLKALKRVESQVDNEIVREMEKQIKADLEK